MYHNIICNTFCQFSTAVLNHIQLVTEGGTPRNRWVSQTFVTSDCKYGQKSQKIEPKQ